MKLLALTLAAAAAIPAVADGLPQFGKDPIKDIVKAMTLEEKVNFIIGANREMELPPPGAPGMPKRSGDQSNISGTSQPSDATAEGAESVADEAVTAFTKGRVKGAAGETLGIERLGIPVTILADGPAGVRIDPVDVNGFMTYGTAFPTGTTLAASWDRDLVKKLTTAIGEEAREYGVDVLLAPGINVHRSPLCGRNYEYYSEDPYLIGEIATAYINGVQSNNVGVSLKHFAVNNQETYRNGIDARVTDRALREIYLRGFEKAVKQAHPWTIMTSYNKINGTQASEAEWLIEGILRNEWGFDGYVMTDWWAEENGARQMLAGNDLIEPGTQRQFDEVLNAVKSGFLPEEVLDRNIERILGVVARTNAAKGYAYTSHPDLKAHAQLLRESAPEGMVLLENREETLPLGKGKKIALFGNSSYDVYVGGSGSGNVNRAYKISPDQGLTEAGYKLDKDLNKVYSKYIKEERAKRAADNFWTVNVIPELAIDDAAIEKAAKNCDVAVLTIGRMAGEGGDRTLEKGDWSLTDLERHHLNKIADAFHKQGKKLIVILNMGGVIDMADWKDTPDAILHAWLPGQEAGRSIADVLSGRVNPSGKLPMTFAKRYEDYGSAPYFPYNKDNNAIADYTDDIFVGYRHFDRAGIEPLYPFGYGKSYTTFKYSDLKVTPTADGYSVAVKVTNTGRRSGKETVQLYVKAPGKTLPKPEKELKGFAKTQLLKPGESQTLVMNVPASDLASWSTATRSWQTEKGTYRFTAAESSATGAGISADVEVK